MIKKNPARRTKQAATRPSLAQAPTQEDILAFIDNPKNINNAVEGSMDKRNKVLTKALACQS